MKHRGGKKHDCGHCHKVKHETEGEWHTLDHLSKWICYQCWTDFLGPIEIDPRRVIDGGHNG